MLGSDRTTRSLRGFLAFVIFFSLFVILTAQTSPKPPTQKSNPEFWPVSALTYVPESKPSLLGARLAMPKDFPASFYSRSQVGFCTSTLVGPRVLLTAAHCVADGDTATVHLGSKTYEGLCNQAPAYGTNETADWALCLMPVDIPGIPYERINRDPAAFKLHAEILLTGFGCTATDGSGGNDGKYRIGEAKVAELPSGTNNDIITRGKVALCFGDSGGPAFLYLDRAKKRRVQISVNSRGNIVDESHLSSTSTQAALTFFQSWSEKNQVKLCGLHNDATGCR